MRKSSESGSYAKIRIATVNFHFWKMPLSQNIVGARLRALRYQRGLTQAMLAARCGTLGWDISENTVTKIETEIRCVTDVELICIAAALEVAPSVLLPASSETKTTIAKHYSRRHHA